jgi:3-methyladenine DNA glycosylase AlkD
MDYNAMVEEIISEMQKEAVEKYRKNFVGFVKTQYKILGVPTAGHIQMRKRFHAKYPDLSIEDRIKLAKILMKSDILEVKGFAYHLIVSHPEGVTKTMPKDFNWLAEGLDNWVSVDTLGYHITGQAWKEGLLTDEMVKSWQKLDNPWMRRLALVSTVPLNREKPGDTKRTLAICTKAVDDHHDAVVKGLSWALRELGKLNPKATGDFIDKYSDRLAARVKREVKNKLTTGLKNPKKKKEILRKAR